MKTAQVMEMSQKEQFKHIIVEQISIYKSTTTWEPVL